MKERLYSLDLLRGLDMFLLVVVGAPMPVVIAVCGSFLHVGAVWIWARLRLNVG